MKQLERRIASRIKSSRTTAHRRRGWSLHQRLHRLHRCHKELRGRCLHLQLLCQQPRRELEGIHAPGSWQNRRDSWKHVKVRIDPWPASYIVRCVLCKNNSSTSFREMPRRLPAPAEPLRRGRLPPSARCHHCSSLDIPGQSALKRRSVSCTSHGWWHVRLHTFLPQWSPGRGRRRHRACHWNRRRCGTWTKLLSDFPAAMEQQLPHEVAVLHRLEFSLVPSAVCSRRLPRVHRREIHRPYRAVALLPLHHEPDPRLHRRIPWRSKLDVLQTPKKRRRLTTCRRRPACRGSRRCLPWQW